MNSSSLRKPHYLPHLKPDVISSPLRKTPTQKKDSSFQTFNEMHSKLKTNAEFNIFNEPIGKITRNSIKYSGSEILKSFNFALNPNLHRKRQLQANMSVVGSLKKNTINHGLITKNILEFRKKNVLAISNMSLQTKPKLKQSRSVCKGTISMLQNTEDTRAALSKKTNDFVQAAKVDISEKARDKIRIQMISWLLENKKEAINLINENKHIILSWINYVGHIDKNEFDNLMVSIGIKNDRTLNDRLFWLFDLNGNGVIESAEMLIAIDMFKEHSIEEKVNVFFDLCDEDGTGFLDEEKLFKFLKKNLKDEEDRAILKTVVKEFAEELNYQNPKSITKDDLLRAATLNPNIKIIVEKNVKVFKNTKKDLKFNSANLISSQFENQSGIYFPYMEKLVKVVEEKEKLIDNFSKVKNQFLKVLRFSKDMNSNESDSEDPLD